jgi:heat shock protein HslJ
VNDTMPESDSATVTRPRRRRWAVLALAVGLSPLAATACTTPPPPPPRPVCGPIDFATATISQSDSLYMLTVTGTKAISQTVTLEPVTYVRQPEYWQINVIACSPLISRPAGGPYTATLDLAGVLGTKGIRVTGATRSQDFDLSPKPWPRLAGSNWVLDPRSLRAPIPTGRSITANFSDTTMSGSASCNSYSAPYEANETRFKVGPIITTDMACTPDVAAAEGEYLRRLAAATTFELYPGSGDIALTGPEGYLRFHRAWRPATT